MVREGSKLKSMDGRLENCGVAFSSCGINIQSCPQDGNLGGLFASVGQAGLAFAISPRPLSPKYDFVSLLFTDSSTNLVSMPEFGFCISEPAVTVDADEDKVVLRKKKHQNNVGSKFKIKVRNPSVRRLISGGIAGAVSRTVVAPLETIRTHLIVGSCGHSTSEVFQSIMANDGWKGLFKGNFVNIIRVAPSKAIELFTYDTVKKHLTPKDGEQPKLPIPASSVAGAVAGISSTLCTYPLELLKTRLTVQRGVYKNLFDAFLKIVREEGPAELYRGLTASLIGVIPYAAANYYAYDTLQKAYKKTFKKEEVGNVTTLLIGSAAAAFSSTATFPLEVARKHMQAGTLSGRQYKHLIHALASILEREGISGLYRGLGPSCLKLVPAAGISFMCYEALKRILIEKEKEP